MPQLPINNAKQTSSDRFISRVVHSLNVFCHLSYHVAEPDDSSACYDLATGDLFIVDNNSY